MPRRDDGEDGVRMVAGGAEEWRDALLFMARREPSVERGNANLDALDHEPTIAASVPPRAGALALETARRAEGDRNDALTCTTLASPAEAGSILRGVLDGRFRIVSSEGPSSERRLIARRTTPSSRHALSPEERTVIELSARGVAGKAIAIELDTAESVVSNRLRRGMQKLGVHTRAELVAFLRLARST